MPRLDAGGHRVIHHLDRLERRRVMTFASARAPPCEPWRRSGCARAGCLRCRTSYGPGRWRFPLSGVLFRDRRAGSLTRRSSSTRPTLFARFPSRALPLRMMSSAAGRPIRSGQFAGPAPRRKDPQLHLGQSDRSPRRIRGNAPVAAQRELAAAAEADAFDRGDSDLRQLRQLRERLLAEEDVGLGLFGDR